MPVFNRSLFRWIPESLTWVANWSTLRGAGDSGEMPASFTILDVNGRPFVKHITMRGDSMTGIRGWLYVSDGTPNAWAVIVNK